MQDNSLAKAYYELWTGIRKYHYLVSTKKILS